MKEYKFKINGNNYAVQVNEIEGTTASVLVNGQTYAVEIEGLEVKKATKIVQVASNTSAAAQSVTPRAAAPAAAGGGTAIKSPLPGSITAISVAVGDTVAVGQRLLVLEAMKMENNIDADVAGVVKSIAVQKGSSVLEGDLLLTIG